MTKKDALIEEYLKQLNQLEEKTLKIAQEHLESSFSIEKSIGFQQYVESQKAKLQ